MKKIISLFILLALSVIPLAAQPKDTDFVKGADVGFLTGQERRGVVFHDCGWRERDCLELLRDDYQMSAIRMRVWVNPRRGECDKNELLAMALLKNWEWTSWSISIMLTLGPTPPNSPFPPHGKATATHR